MTRRKLWTAVMVLGLALVLGAAGLAGYNLWIEQRAGAERDGILTELAEAAFEMEGTAGQETETAVTTLPVLTVDGHGYLGTMSIPALKLELPVLAEYSYEDLKVAPSVFYGSPLTYDLVVCAHNYRSHFGTLKNLVPGDRVLFRTMDGYVFTYEVAATEVVDPWATADVISGQWDLTMFTCTLGGRTRLVIRCDQV